MSRPPRVHVSGGFYHVTLRGNHRQPIFRSGTDRDTLDGIVGEVTRDASATVHAYCWMSNHIHAVVQVDEAPLAAIMQRIATRYARYFQKTLRTTGHLFERRYHAVMVARDSQLLATARYVHLNPVRAGLADDPGEYPWSGHRAYLWAGGPAWLRTDLALSMLDADPGRARAMYAAFVAGAEPATDAGAAAPQPDPGGPRPPVLHARQSAGRSPLDRLVARICAEENIDEQWLTGPSRARRLAHIRTRIAREAVESGTSSLSDVARRLHRHVATLSKAVSRRRRPG